MTDSSMQGDTIVSSTDDGEADSERSSATGGADQLRDDEGACRVGEAGGGVKRRLMKRVEGGSTVKDDAKKEKKELKRASSHSLPSRVVLILA